MQIITKNKCGRDCLIAEAMKAGVIALFMQFLDDEMAGVKDVSGAKVFIIQVLKCLPDDPSHGEQANGMLLEYPVWAQYRTSKHDLFVSRNEKSNIFLEVCIHYEIDLIYM